MDEPRFTNIWLRTTKPTKPYILITDLRRFFNLRSNINLINDPQKNKKTPDGSEVQPRQRTLPSHLDDSVVLCPMPQYRDTASSSTADVAAYRCIKSRANILTRVQSKAYTEPSSFSSLFNLPYSKDIHYFSQARHIAHSTTQCRKL